MAKAKCHCNDAVQRCHFCDRQPDIRGFDRMFRLRWGSGVWHNICPSCAE
jgi:hypothetical protein